MATWAIGDIQGCFDEFRALLDKIRFDPGADQLWLTGDLVNRGTQSLQALRFVRSLGDSVITVLGNHDLHLLAVAAGHGPDSRENASLRPILDADDRDELLDWLRHRPLAHFDANLNTLLVHAGLPPEWTPADAVRLAREVELRLAQNDHADFFAAMYADKPDRWNEALVGDERHRFIVNCLTRLRVIDENGSLDLAYKGTLDDVPPGTLPWFRAPEARWRRTRIVFGHWSALGLLVERDLLALDTGCVWGRELTAVRLDGEPVIVAQSCSNCAESAL